MGKGATSAPLISSTMPSTSSSGYFEPATTPWVVLPGRVYYRALVHFTHLLWVLSAFTLTDPAELSALKVTGWRTRNGKKIKCKTMDTTRTKRAPSWLPRSPFGSFSQEEHVYFGRFSFASVASRFASVTSALDSRVSRVDLRPSLAKCKAPGSPLPAPALPKLHLGSPVPHNKRRLVRVSDLILYIQDQ